LSFWYGLSFQDVAGMPQSAIQAYLDQMPSLQAELGLLLATTTAYPHMEQTAREQLMREWQGSARHLNNEMPSTLTPAQLKIKQRVDLAILRIKGLV
jgi:hypothetical protein